MKDMKPKETDLEEMKALMSVKENITLKSPI